MNFDIVIIGGGMVGASLASALKNSSLRIALVDSSPQVLLNDPRLIALNYASVQFLKSLGLFEQLKPAACAIQEVHVSEKGRFGATRIKAKEIKLSELGYVIPAKNINTILENSLQNSSIQWIRPATLQELSEKNDRVDLTLQQPTGDILKMSTTLLVAADGTHSTVRQLLSIPVTVRDEQQSAMVAIVQLARSHQQIAYERFVDKGAIAMLPLIQDQSAMIWTAPHAEMASLMELNDDAFLAQLQIKFGLKLGRLQKIGNRAVFPLKAIQTEKRVYGRMALIGNAAHTLHPLAAQGLNLALHEVKLLSQIILSAPACIDFQQFEKYSLSEQITLQFSGCLNRVFSTDFFPINRARQLGMIGLNISGIIKRRMALLLAGIR